MKKTDIFIIGSGPSGILCAIFCAKNNQKTILLEKNKQIGKKLLLTGGGRCNVTNNKPIDELIAHVPRNGKFLYSAFSNFSSQDIIQLFEKAGVSLKEEDHGRMFPTTNSSKTIVETLYNLLKKHSVDLHVSEMVEKISKTDDGFSIQTNKESYHAKKVVIATGGKTFPQTGSTGDGYQFAKQFGHTITPLFPTEVALVSQETVIQSKVLQGVSLQDVKLSVLNAKGKAVVSHTMDVLFTHFGISGPAALRSSTFVQKILEKEPHATITIDVFPELSLEDVRKKIASLVSEEEKSIKNTLGKLCAQAYMQVLFEKLNFNIENKAKTLTPKEIEAFCQLLKKMPFKVNGTLPIEKAFVTGGGVSLKEINPKTMESKLCDNLYFIGEVLDYNCYTGGYNITAAFATGVTAANAITNSQ